jgi:L-iditol 2-dehydrogenase
MKVAAITETNKVELLEVKRPTPGKGEVLVDIKACALCTWEQRTFAGVIKMPLPFIGGHEMSGVIAEVGEDVNKETYPIGQRVSVRTLYSCGECYYCRQGKENLCENKGKPVVDQHKEIWGPGGLGEYLVVNVKDIYKLPNDLPFEYGAFTEPLACVVNSMEQGKVELGSDVLIIGAGIMGLLHVMVCKLRGARVILSEPDEGRRKLAEELGADVTFDPTKEDLEEKIKSLTQGRGADVVFNTTPIAPVAEQAIKAVGKTGTVVMYSSIHPDKPIEVNPNWIHNSQTKITGSVSPTIKAFHTSSILLSKGLIVPDKLITNKYPIEEAQKAFEEAVKPQSFRVIITQK